MSTSSGDSETWSSSVENRNQTDVAEDHETWSKFLRLIEPERTYNKFFVWLTRSIQLMSLYKGCNVAAEDVAGDTILRVLRSMSKGTEIKKDTFNAFVIRVAKNHLIDYKRHGSGEILLSLLELGDSRAVEPEPEAHFKFGMLLKAEPDLTDEEMQMLTLLSYGFSGTEIAAELDISEQSARKRISRFRKKLRDKLIQISDGEVPSGEHFRVKIGDIEMAKRVNVSSLAHTAMQFPIMKTNSMTVTPRFWIGSKQSFIARAQGTRTALEEATRLASRAQEARTALKKATRLASQAQEACTALEEAARLASRAQEARTALEKATRLASQAQGTRTAVEEATRLASQAQGTRTAVEEATRLACAKVTQAVTPEMKPTQLGYAAVARAFASRKLESDLMSVLASELKAAGSFCPLPGFIGDQAPKNSAAGD